MSDATLPPYGVARLVTELRQLGFEVEPAQAQGQDFAIITGYEVPAGRFRDRVIDLALPAPPNYPQAVGSSIHVRSVLHLLDLSDTIPDTRNIIESPLGPAWRYWSYQLHPPGGWTARTYLSCVNVVFERV